jgi:hypothetical protein
MRRALNVAVILWAMSCVQCTPRPEYQLYNNTAETIEVKPDDGEGCAAAPRGGPCAFRSFGAFRVIMRARSSWYTLPEGLRYEGSREWVEVRPISKHVIKLQLDDDGKIFILPASALSVVPGPHARQRTGFPLRPREAR